VSVGTDRDSQTHETNIKSCDWFEDENTFRLFFSRSLADGSDLLSSLPFDTTSDPAYITTTMNQLSIAENSIKSYMVA
jgi:hypothetical protein